MLSDLTSDQKQLANYMSDISEKCYSAGWLANLEYVLWNAINNGALKFGHDFITRDDIDKLKTFSTNCNCWIYYDDKNEETAIDIFSWIKKFDSAVFNDPNILKG